MKEAPDAEKPATRKWNVLQEVFADRNLSAAAKVVFGRLLWHDNAKDNNCFPSYQTLADGAGMSRRTVIDAVASLVAAGWVEKVGRLREDTTTGGMLHTSNLFRVSLNGPSGEKSAPLHDERGSEKSAPLDVGSSEKSALGWCSNFTRGSEKSAPITNEVLTTENNHYSVEASPVVRGTFGERSKSMHADTAAHTPDRKANAPKAGKPAALADPIFDRFWDAYPKRAGSNKGECRKKFAAAVRGGADPETIIRQASAYAGHCIREGNVGDRARYIKQAQAWLNQRAWEADWGDVPTPAGSAGKSEITADEWRAAVANYRNTGEWQPRRFGPEPHAPGCRVPPQYLPQDLKCGAA